MSDTSITGSDQGKRVVNAEGTTIGVVAGVRGDTAFVDPDPGITGTIKSKLGWDTVDEDDYPLHDDRIERITDDEIRLVEDM